MNLQKLLKISIAVQLVALVAFVFLGLIADTSNLHPLLQEYLAWEEENITLSNSLAAMLSIFFMAYLIAMNGLWNFNKWAKPVFIVSIVAITLSVFPFMTILSPLDSILNDIIMFATGFTVAILFTDIELNQPFKWSIVIAPIALLLVMALSVFYFII
jgi:hypothetical protein